MHARKETGPGANRHISHLENLIFRKRCFPTLLYSILWCCQKDAEFASCLVSRLPRHRPITCGQLEGVSAWPTLECCAPNYDFFKGPSDMKKSIFLPHPQRGSSGGNGLSLCGGYFSFCPRFLVTVKIQDSFYSSGGTSESETWPETLVCSFSGKHSPCGTNLTAYRQSQPIRGILSWLHGLGWLMG